MPLPMNTRTLLAALAIALAPAVLLPPTAGAQAPVYTGTFDNIAVQGHDPVAYFTDGKPVKGTKAFTATYKGAEFRFASAANRDAFLENPDAYAPQFGGYCAWAVSQGYTAKGDARHWKIVEGKLYLNYNSAVQKTWEGDIPGFIASANTHWPTLID